MKTNKTDIATLYRILALLQTSNPDTVLAAVLVTRLLVRHDKSYGKTKITEGER